MKLDIVKRGILRGILNLAILNPGRRPMAPAFR